MGCAGSHDATRHSHETLLLTVTQIGMSLARYQGDLGTWVQRLFRRSLRETRPDPVEEALLLLQRRDHRQPRQGPGDRDDAESSLPIWGPTCV